MPIHADQVFTRAIEANEGQTLGVFDEDHVGNVFDDRVQKSIEILDVLAYAMTVRFIARYCEPGALRKDHGPGQVAVVSSVASKARVKNLWSANWRWAREQARYLLTVVRMNELDERLSEQVHGPISQLRERRIDEFKPPV